jgi:PAS domain S-box-containing protein
MNPPPTHAEPSCRPAAELTTPESGARADPSVELIAHLAAASASAPVAILLAGHPHDLAPVSVHGTNPSSAAALGSLVASQILQAPGLLRVPDVHSHPGLSAIPDPWSPLGVASFAGCTLRHADDSPLGVLCVFDRVPRGFSDIALDGLALVARHAARLMEPARSSSDPRAEHRLRQEKEFSATMLESLPGILYFYDLQGRFLRWNRNFEKVSGYSAAEIARMHPLDFFRPDARARIRDRIAEVFESGESAVEAEFLSKDGSTTPYYFTGRRVCFGQDVCLVGVGIDVSERRRAEQRVAESERKYRELVEHANSIILRWNSEGRITFLNEFGQKFFGFSSDEIVGRHVVGTIVPPVESTGRDLRRLVDEICSCPRSFELSVNENMRRDGERVWIEWTNRVVREGDKVEFLSVGSNVTERQQAEERLRESEAHLIEAQRIAGIGSWNLDLRTDRIRWSDQVYEIFGLQRIETFGTFQDLLAFVHPEDRARLQAAKDAAAMGLTPLDVEHRIVLRDGSQKHVHELAKLKRDPDGRPVSLSGTVHDITHRKLVEAEKEKRLRAEAADRIKSAFLATMSHELRTPLNSILGFTGILLQGLAGPLNPEQAKQLGMVRASARHLHELINDVLDISKIEAGQLEVRAEPFPLPDSIERVVGAVRPLADKKGLAIRTHLPPNPPSMLSDRRRFEQILINLLNNAIKFTDKGHVELHAELLPEYLPPTRTDAPTPIPAPSGPALRVRIRDTGIGIKPENLPVLFEPFRQLDTGLTRQHEGTGLGLAICRKLAAMLSGEITVQSEWQVGSEFALTLPLRPPATP